MNYFIPLKYNCLLTRYPILIITDQNLFFYRLINKVLIAHGYQSFFVLEKDAQTFLNTRSSAFHLLSPKDFTQDSSFMRFFINTSNRSHSIIVTNHSIKKFNFLDKKNWLSFFDKIQKIAEADYINSQINKRLQNAEV